MNECYSAQEELVFLRSLLPLLFSLLLLLPFPLLSLLFVMIIIIVIKKIVLGEVR